MMFNFGFIIRLLTLGDVNCSLFVFMSNAMSNFLLMCRELAILVEIKEGE